MDYGHVVLEAAIVLNCDFIETRRDECHSQL